MVRIIVKFVLCRYNFCLYNEDANIEWSVAVYRVCWEPWWTVFTWCVGSGRQSNDP